MDEFRVTHKTTDEDGEITHLWINDVAFEKIVIIDLINVGNRFYTEIDDDLVEIVIYNVMHLRTQRKGVIKDDLDELPEHV